MIPSLVAGELQEAIVEYLSTTFALSDDETRAALAGFLADTTEGIFRGPYLRVRTPFRAAPDGWSTPLDWQPAGFRPYLHQASAFERLSSREGPPQPTLITTGTGSGKTESFLVPILDHCRRANAAGRTGVKALLLYPMNALATDQARRLARLLHGEPGLSGVTAGLYIGGDGTHATPGPDHLVDDRRVLQALPPDILLTNYKMLDWLLLRRQDRDLWASDRPGTLQYIVLDEFHTYDGAQGTDVAMLLRRLGSALGLATPDRPLGSCTPVATSATLGSGTQSSDAMRGFAERIFGTPFDADAVIGETRQTAEEACHTVDYRLPIPDVSDLADAADDDFDALVAAFIGRTVSLDPVNIGQILLAHPLTRAVLSAGAAGSVPWADAIQTVVTRAPQWGAAAQDDPLLVHRALARYLALLSLARRRHPVTGAEQPLFSIEVQLWVREVSRLLRTVGSTPSFRWYDSAPVDEDAAADRPPVELPAVYCRHCGRAGWMALASELDGSLVLDAPDIYQASVQAPARTRALIRADEREADVAFLDAATGELHPQSAPETVAVLVTTTEDHARRSQCPSCDQADGIRFLGSQVATLASVSISQLFGSNLVHGEERKLLAFTDSVQDASHRASFFAGRTHRFNARTQMAKIVHEAGRVRLDDLGDDLLTDAGHDPGALHALAPPDLLHHPRVKTLWTDRPDAAGRAVLRTRLAFEAALEVGLRSRVGRTLELTATIAAAVDLPDLGALADLVAEAHRSLTGQGALDLGLPGHEIYVRGLVERLRLRGGIDHPWLAPYLAEDGNQWRIWGGRPDGMPAFAQGQSRPAFFTTGPGENLDSLTANPRTPTWLIDWAGRTLGVDPGQARALNRQTCVLLAAEEVLSSRTSNRGATIFGVPARNIVIHDLEPDEAGEPEPDAVLRCRVCIARHVVPPDHVDRWTGTPCLRYRCPGSYEPAPAEPSNYYRRLYRSRTMRRVVTAEHTGLLTRQEREQLEHAFKQGTAPDAPNVVACTPTMEMGIDIGDLSAVLLTSMPRRPASYVQRVGRTGRLTGNAFVAAFVPTNPHALYYLEQPEHMISGEIRPPSCYLDAEEILSRQYLAFLADRAAAGIIDAPALPDRIGQLVAGGLDAGGWLHTVVSASMLDRRHAEDFLALFGDAIAPDTGVTMHAFAAGGIEQVVKTAIAGWEGRMADFGRRRDRLKTSIERLEEQGHRTDEEETDLRQLRGERRAVIRTMREEREGYTLSALERIGLLPNYTLHDDAVTLEATLWSAGEGDHFESSRTEYSRPAARALTEFAPGNHFYGRGHRLLIDALDVGTGSDPLDERWRLCPDCGYGAVEEAGRSWASCPRCGLTGISDTGASHRMVRINRVYSSDSEEGARVFDESDERERLAYHIVSSVDVDPRHIVRAHVHKHQTFGVEWAREVVIRHVNLGPVGRPAEGVRIAGEHARVPRFETCRWCGVVKGVRRPGEARHRGWCLTRSKRSEVWDHLVTYHQLRTEAVRLLLPVSTFEVDERLASFKGALLLGLRLDFGGEPEHLEVTAAHFPATGGNGRRRFLVVHDTVPGGTGYLGRIADPERLRQILDRARAVISRCPCRNEGRAACHRCLLGAVGPREIGLVSRTLALELLDQLLDDWELEPVESVADLDTGLVEESELERRFRVALTDWASLPASGATLTRAPTSGARAAYELRLTDGDAVRRYLIEEQQTLATSPATTPDYLVTRQDENGPQVAVYLDGHQFHASTVHNRLADDALKRAGVRVSGRLVWNLTWDDVHQFHEAAAAPVSRDAPDRALLDSVGQRAAERAHHSLAARRRTTAPADIRAVHHNPLRLLIDVLRHPDRAAWEDAALSTLAGLTSRGSTTRIGRTGVADVITSAAAGTPVAADEGDDVLLVDRRTSNGLALRSLLDVRPEVGGGAAERWTVVASLDDSAVALADADHRARWHDWLQWANLLQFLQADGRQAWIGTTSLAGTLDLGEFDIVPGATIPTAEGPEAGTPGPVVLGRDAEEELELILDDRARSLTEAALRAGAPVPTAGYEPDAGGDRGWMIEVAWPERRVAILTETDPALASWLAAEGWTARSVDEWDEGALVHAVADGN
jgi:ATP-dependent helicase YprA (DUF1998 family)